jgi:hypothetical protein
MPAPSPEEIAPRQARFGWHALLVFLSLGLVLEALHGFKASLYVDAMNEMRRFLWTLAHAHGTLLSLLNIVFGLSLRAFGAREGSEARLQLASRCLMGAAVLMPAGFFLGGALPYGGDPGLGTILVPIGGLLLFGGVFLAARGLRT